MEELNKLIATLYQTISFKGGIQPELEKLKNLFTKDGRLINNNEDQPRNLLLTNLLMFFNNRLITETLVNLKKEKYHQSLKFLEILLIGSVFMKPGSM